MNVAEIFIMTWLVILVVFGVVAAIDSAVNRGKIRIAKLVKTGEPKFIVMEYEWFGRYKPHSAFRVNPLFDSVEEAEEAYWTWRRSPEVHTIVKDRKVDEIQTFVG